MQPFREILERYDRLWDQAERLVEAYFSRHRPTRARGSKGKPRKPRETCGPEAADIKELNTAVTILKRIQDARRAIHLDAIKLEDSASNAKKCKAEERPDPMDDKEVSRLRRLLEESNGAQEDRDEETV